MDEAKAAWYFVSMLEGHRMLGEVEWHEYQQSVQRMSAYTLQFAPWHLYEAARHFDLYTMLHDDEFVSRSGEAELSHLPDQVRFWAYGSRRVSRSSVTGIYQAPGDWFTIMEQ